MDLLVHSRCPGKLILTGEHATVYGKNAVAITVDLYTDVKVYGFDNQTVVKLVLENFDNFEISWPVDQLSNVPSIVGPDKKFVFNEEILAKVQKLVEGQLSPGKIYNSCIAFLLLYLGCGDVSTYSERKSLLIKVSSKMPNGAGLGSSSSYIVSLAYALFTAHNVQIDKEELNKWCYEVDKLFHGKPSGIDNSICTFGGAILFGCGNIIERINSEHLADLSNLQVILVNTNVSRNTKAMVEKCRERLDQFPVITNHILEAIANISQSLWNDLKGNNFTNLSKLFEINQNLLNCLDVGHQMIDRIVTISKNNGLTAKLTGAGGGGIVIVVLANSCDNKEDCLIRQLHSEGFNCYQVKLGVPGVITL